jgi:hypothetical protein
MTLFAPAHSTESLVNDLGTRYKHSLISDEQMNIAQDAEKQLAVRTGGFSLNRLFVHPRRPLLQIAGGAGNDLLRSKNTALELYLLIPTTVSCFILASVIYALVFSEGNKTAAALHAPSNQAEKLYSQEIFLHDNAFFSQKESYSSSPPTTPILEGKYGAEKEKAGEIEDEITLLTPSQVPESQQPLLNATPSPYPTAAATVDEGEDSLSRTLERQFDGTFDDHISAATISLGPRASLKVPSALSPSAVAPAHKTGDTIIKNEAFVHAEDSDIYKPIDTSGIWETAPLRVEPTPATVHAVSGEDDQATDNEAAANVSKKAQEKPRWIIEDLRKELKATQEMVAGLKIGLSR